MKISLITIVYNGEAFLDDCIQSVINQTYKDVEYIVVDGGSKDNTLTIINQHREHIHSFLSQQDKGLYDALNKGIKMASGDIIGIIHADDMLASEDVLMQIAEAFKNDQSLEAVYGNLNYIHPHTRNVIRNWVSNTANSKDIERGWMPAHPTLYIKRELFEKYGDYALDMGTTADYDLILRYFYQYKIKALYLAVLMVNMRTGGLSNKTLLNRLEALKNDYKALKRNKLPNPILTLIMKKMAKLKQFL